MSESSSAIVTGGAQGFGSAICLQLLKQGYKVCVADVQRAKGERFVTDQQKQFGTENVIFSLCDVTKESDFRSTFELTLKTFQRVDLLVNNAGINVGEPMAILQVNLLGCIFGCQTALKYMGENCGGKGGIVINIASGAGLLPVPSMPVYSASKHGVVGLTRCYGTPFHLVKEGIVFAALCPSVMDTEMLDNIKGNIEFPPRWGVMSPEYAANGVTKILEDKINGSTLLVTPEGYQYIGYPEELNHKLLLE